MSKIESGHSELVSAFSSHKKLVGTSCTHNMILFYAVECGLKAMVCSSKYGSRPKRISDVILFNGTKATTHQVNHLVRHLKLPAVVGKCPDVRVKSNHASSSVDHGDIHQAWRYGVKLEQSLETEAVMWLKKMIPFLESKI